MKKLILCISVIFFLFGCSGTPPSTKEPKGNWKQINDPHYYKESAELRMKGK